MSLNFSSYLVLSVSEDEISKGTNELASNHTVSGHACGTRTAHIIQRKTAYLFNSFYIWKI
jgi:hypothetical protein